ncbi:MAG: homoserine dehydrogenase, partial [Candidatus Altiarchaeales archaeon]|nr:homoserine dehydrogenase [Candidatus Altiarchaeales archaeon]
DIVLELTPGDIKTGEPGLTHIKEALGQGMNVVTSNKAPLALKFRELMKEAQKNNIRLRYEATVGGGIPIINLYDNGLRINEIKSVYGILNGTSNYILGKMEEELLDLETALKEAKDLGIAEPDPSYDIKGIDTGAKVAILANSLMDMEVSFKDINIVGIEDITPEAVDLAKKHGYSIKLIGDVRRLEVSPRLIPMDHPMNVSGFLNAITINTDLAKDITLIGRGAGAEETASSIFSDILSILDH